MTSQPTDEYEDESESTRLSCDECGTDEQWEVAKTGCGCLNLCESCSYTCSSCNHLFCKNHIKACDHCQISNCGCTYDTRFCKTCGSCNECCTKCENDCRLHEVYYRWSCIKCKHQYQNKTYLICQRHTDRDEIRKTRRCRDCFLWCYGCDGFIPRNADIMAYTTRSTCKNWYDCVDSCPRDKIFMNKTLAKCIPVSTIVEFGIRPFLDIVTPKTPTAASLFQHAIGFR